MSKETIKGTVRDILVGALNSNQPWYTVPELAKLLPASTPESTIARALRKLFEEGQVSRQRDPDHYRYKQWTALPGRQTSFTLTPVPAGDITMEIAKAVEQIVTTEFVAKQQPFSAHEITTALRAAVTAGTLVVDQAIVGTVHVGGGKPVARIEHPLVRDAVHALWTHQQLPGYTREYQKDAGGQAYVKYVPVPATVAADPAAADPAAPPTPASAPYDGSSTL